MGLGSKFVDISTLATEATLLEIKTNTDNIPAQGQALAAGSMPVVLTAAQEAALTPPAAITGFALESTLDSIKDTDGIKKITDELPAGTQIIGKVGIDQTTPGTTNRVSVGSAINGPGEPTIDSFTSAAVNLAANTANQSVISAPGANKQIWIYGLAGTANVAGTISLQDEDDTAITGVMPVGITGGWVLPMSGNFAMPWKKVATNKAVEIDTVTCEFDGIIVYAIVSV